MKRQQFLQPRCTSQPPSPASPPPVAWKQKFPEEIFFSLRLSNVWEAVVILSNELYLSRLSR